MDLVFGYAHARELKTSPLRSGRKLSDHNRPVPPEPFNGHFSSSSMVCLDVASFDTLSSNSPFPSLRYVSFLHQRLPLNESKESHSSQSLPFQSLRTSKHQSTKAPKQLNMVAQVYKTFTAEQVTDDMLVKAAGLFNENYGVWAKLSKQAGEQAVEFLTQHISTVFGRKTGQVE